jgi:uncharacterized protein
MEWLNEPASWQRNGDVLRVSVDPGTDFWRATGYGYIHDNGHVYGDRLPGDLDVSVRIRGAFASQYDQAGIMLRAGEETWLKTGLEFFEGRPRLSTVLTTGRSSWMVADLPPGTDEVTLRVSRRGDAVEVRYAAGDGAAELAALVFMPPDREMLAGIMCAAPEGTGFSVAFHDLRVVGREWSGQEVAGGAGWASEPAARDEGWAAERAAGAGPGWVGEAAAWPDERAGDRAVSWAGDEEREARPAWAGDRDRTAGPAWAGDADREAGPAWAGGEEREAGPPWARDGDREAEPAWAGEADHEAGPAWAGDADREAGPVWAGDRDRKAGPAWAGDRRDDAAPSWAGDKPGESAPGRAAGKPDDGAARWAEDRPGEATGGWDAGQPGKLGPGRADERPASQPAARKSTAGVPDGWDDELPGDESLDWAKPQDSEPSADWDRLSLNLSTTSWNAFAAASPTEERPGESPREQEQPGRPAAGQAGRNHQDSAGEQPEPPAGEQPEPPARDRAEPVLTQADPAEAAGPDETARGRNGRGKNGKNKAKVPVPPALPPPADPADEWISLLTADSAEELSGSGPVEELSPSGPVGELSGSGPAGELSGPPPGEPDPE